MKVFRGVTPKRTFKKNYRSYRQYKNPLQTDFNKRCGYCNCEDVWLGGKRVFHIDHFAPWKRFELTHPEIKILYINLVYSCPYCNGLKSDDWVSNDPYVSIVGNKGYIDPCKPDYDAAFARNELGEIIPLTEVAKYMYEKLALGLERHSIIWQLEKTRSLIKELGNLIESSNVSQDYKENLIQLRQLIQDSFFTVFDEFEQTLK